MERGPRRGEAGRTLGEGVAPTTIELSRLNKYLWGRAHRPILLSGQPVKKREEKKKTSLIWTRFSYTRPVGINQFFMTNYTREKKVSMWIRIVSFT